MYNYQGAHLVGMITSLVHLDFQGKNTTENERLEPENAPQMKKTFTNFYGSSR